MPLENSTNLINLQDVFSDGSLRNHYTKRWNQNRLSDIDVTEGIKEYDTGWVRTETGMQLSLSAKFKATSPEYNDILRIACHQAIENVPNDGLVELSEILGDMLEFYSERVAAIPMASLVLASSETAIAGKEYTREPLYLTED